MLNLQKLVGSVSSDKSDANAEYMEGTASDNVEQIVVPLFEGEDFNSLNEINQIYQQRILQNPGDFKLKSCILTEWVIDLLQQSCVMIGIIQQLEEEAICRIHIKCKSLDATTVTECEGIFSNQECENTSKERNSEKLVCKKCSRSYKELDKIQRCLDAKLCEKQQELCALKKKMECLSKKYSNAKFETELKTDIINTMRKNVRRSLPEKNCPMRELF